jgi:hypothetical protein
LWAEKTKADPYGMTNKKDNSNRKGSNNGNSKSEDETNGNYTKDKVIV